MMTIVLYYCYDDCIMTIVMIVIICIIDNNTSDNDDISINDNDNVTAGPSHITLINIVVIDL